MSTKTKATSIFTDDSGSRKRAVTVAVRAAVGLIGLSAAAVAVSVFGHVTLPGLETPLHIPSVNRTNPTTDDPDSGTAGSTDGNLSTSTDKYAPSTASTPNSTGSTPKTTGPTTVPTTLAATPTTRATGKPTAKPTAAATPTQGTRPTDPGNAHSTDSGQ